VELAASLEQVGDPAQGQRALPHVTEPLEDPLLRLGFMEMPAQAADPPARRA
jgi:hypothetical protein